ncbi:MAG: ATP phosphoribosyltransferase [Clostridia bacterium]|nr:ATP phosphoribosyltransferase [Clostridia bacterium]
MIVNESSLSEKEVLSLKLRDLFFDRGYRPYRMSRFEEYDLYAKNKDFLVSDRVITFSDLGGKLMALKPDVTLSIIKNTEDRPDETRKVFYSENVYRAEKTGDSFREITQLGVECFGRVGPDETVDVLSLARESLLAASEDCVLTVSDLSFLSGILDKLSLSLEEERSLVRLISEKNLHGMRDFFEQKNLPEDLLDVLKELSELSGSLSDVLPSLTRICGETPCRTLSLLAGRLPGDRLVFDFSVTGDLNYYNGLVFKGWISGIPFPVLSGGQYDRLMARMHRKSSAIGFAVYLNLLERPSVETTDASSDYLNIALPKGRLGEKVYRIFEKAGLECPEVLDKTRKLIFENPEKKVRYFWVKPSDVAIYVERGAADLGVAGKDLLLEDAPDVCELADLNEGLCRMAVAAKEDFTDDPSKTLRVATKFPNVARDYYRSVGREIELIRLQGSVELAPILGLSDVIVDIVETGSTLRENRLKTLATVFPISARLVANRMSMQFKAERIRSVVQMINRVRSSAPEKENQT